MSVFDLKKGESGKIISVAVDGAAGERLRALGVAEGRTVKAIAFSLLNGSVLICAGYNRIGIRKSVALRIGVERC